MKPFLEKFWRSCKSFKGYLQGGLNADLRLKEESPLGKRERDTHTHTDTYNFMLKFKTIIQLFFS